MPAAGGKARRMNCNTPLMNSWHSFSPNGRWLVFSSKSRSPYTQMFLTHLDKDGNDSPPILIDNTTASNRAVNIPEFVNIPPDGMLQIDPQATDFYRLSDEAWDLSKAGKYGEAIDAWKKALELSPENDRANSNLGLLLVSNGRFDEAVPYLEKTLAANPDYPDGHSNLGVALAGAGKVDRAISEFEKALEIDPSSAEAHNNLGRSLIATGKFEQAVPHLRTAAELKPDAAEIHNSLAIALVKTGHVDEAIPHFERAVEIDPSFVEAHFNLGDALYYLQGKAREALEHWQAVLRAEPNHVPVLDSVAWVLATSRDDSLRNGTRAVELAERAVRVSGGKSPSLFDTLAAAYAETGRFSEAVELTNRNLALARQQNNRRLIDALTARQALYQAGTPLRDAVSPPH
jgi:tetratricopeptide (TPR) repeat protein